jgi:hypothetical protein
MIVEKLKELELALERHPIQVLPRIVKTVLSSWDIELLHPP